MSRLRFDAGKGLPSRKSFFVWDLIARKFTGPYTTDTKATCRID